MTELKPCPFCGSSNVETCKDEYGHWMVICNAYGCRVAMFNHKWALETERDAIELWNRRKEDEE